MKAAPRDVGFRSITWGWCAVTVELAGVRVTCEASTPAAARAACLAALHLPPAEVFVPPPCPAPPLALPGAAPRTRRAPAPPAPLLLSDVRIKGRGRLGRGARIA